MTPRCIHLDQCGHCGKGLFGGRPSHGVCMICDEYDGPDRGAGDKVHRAAKRIGADKVARGFEKITRRPCGCRERRRKLNQRFPADS